MGQAGFSEAPFGFAPAGVPNLAPDDLRTGARNLLLGCAGVQRGQRVVILHEDPALGWYDFAAPHAVAKEAEALGALVELVQVGGPGRALRFGVAAMQMRADVEIWFARIGDQDRFRARCPDRVTVVSYARTAGALASTFGTRPHADMLALKDRVNARLAGAARLRVTCPLGTDLSGSQDVAEAEEVTVRRFPMTVPRPIPARGFSGRVALTGYLTPTGSRSYSPASVPIEGVVMAHLEQGRITGFEGDRASIDRVRAHYAHVAALFSIDPDVVHSFHAGIHPGCAFPDAPEVDPDRWANTIFGSPHWLHFHTCGNYAPGEICWMVAQPTIRADGIAVWQDGVLVG